MGFLSPLWVRVASTRKQWLTKSAVSLRWISRVSTWANSLHGSFQSKSNPGGHLEKIKSNGHCPHGANHEINLWNSNAFSWIIAQKDSHLKAKEDHMDNSPPYLEKLTSKGRIFARRGKQSWWYGRIAGARGVGWRGWILRGDSSQWEDWVVTQRRVETWCHCLFDLSFTILYSFWNW